MEKTRAFFRASRSTLANFESFVSGEKFNAMFLAALDYTSRHHGIKIKPNNRDLVKHTLRLGVLINDFYDIKSFQSSSYHEIRKLLQKNPKAESQFSLYFKLIRNLERNRPLPGEREKCIIYREETNLISLAINSALAFDTLMVNFISITPNYEVKLKPETPNWFKALYYSVMALQVFDDMIGYQGDLLNNRPSFFTAYGTVSDNNLTDSIIQSRYKQMNPLFNEYIRRAKEVDDNFIYPITFISQAIYQTYPKIASLVYKPAINIVARLILSKRDRLRL